MTVGEMVQRRRLGWLGHVARMPDHRILKSMLFGWLSQPRPPRRWRDVIWRDLKELRIREDEWYEEAESRLGWRAMCRLGIEEVAETRQSQRQRATATNDVECEVCGM